MRRLDHLEVHIRHVAEARARIVRIATGLGEKAAGRDMLPIRNIELADVAVEEGDRVTLVVLEYIRHDNRSPSLWEAGDGPVGDLVGRPRCHRVERGPAV